MTGFGQGRALFGDEELLVEIKSVNHKYCEVKVRLPREWAALEGAISKKVRDQVARGALDVSVRRQATPGASAALSVDVPLAKAYQAAWLELSDALKRPASWGIPEIAILPGVVKLEERAVDIEAVQLSLESAVSGALTALKEMRAREGDQLRGDLEARLATVERRVDEVRQLSANSVDDYRRRLENRLKEMSLPAPVEPQRLAQEVALLAERTDIAEEMTRLVAHLHQFRKLMKGAEPSGRKLDFLVQEMHREVNTTGSKSQSPDISHHVVELKAELERIREQVQNIE